MERFVRARNNRNSGIVHVKELPKATRNGKSCDCRCVDCHEPLEACQGEVNEWFFRHQFKTDCKGGQMTALHLLAQQLLTGHHLMTTSNGEVSYYDGEPEWTINDSFYKADVAGLKSDGSRFLIEIFVTHKLAEEEEKVRHIRQQNIHAIEINLSSVDLNIEKEDLLKLLVSDVSKQREIHAPKSDRTALSVFQVLIVGAVLLWVFSNIRSFFARLKKP